MSLHKYISGYPNKKLPLFAKNNVKQGGFLLNRQKKISKVSPCGAVARNKGDSECWGIVVRISTDVQSPDKSERQLKYLCSSLFMNIVIRSLVFKINTSELNAKPSYRSEAVCCLLLEFLGDWVKLGA